MNLKKLVFVTSLIVLALFSFFLSMHISKNFFSAIILKQNHNYIQEERLKIFEKPKPSHNQNSANLSLNKNDKSKNLLHTQNKDVQVEKQEKMKKLFILLLMMVHHLSPLLYSKFWKRKKLKLHFLL